jgi:hypothetical protein
MKASVRFEDARRAVSEAKQHSKAKAAAMLQASNKTWADKVAAARADAQQVLEQLQELEQQRDQLLQEVRHTAVCDVACSLLLTCADYGVDVTRQNASPQQQASRP